MDEGAREREREREKRDEKLVKKYTGLLRARAASGEEEKEESFLCLFRQHEKKEKQGLSVRE